MARAQPCGCRRQTGARRHLSKQGTTQLQGKGARAATTAAAPAKRLARLDGRLSDDGGSARRRGAGHRSKNDTDETTGLALFSLLGTKAKLHSEEGNVVLTSGQRMQCEAVLKRLGKMDAELGRWRTGWSRGSRGWFGSFLPRTAPASGRTTAPASPAVHAWHPLLRRPRLQAGRRRGGPAARRLRLELLRLLLPLPFPFCLLLHER
jgi:hypothetical protein